MHDIADLERRGVVGAFVASTEFIEAADAQARSLGVEPASVFVPHPIQDRTDTEMRALAEGAFDEILRAVTAP
ncbi:MAG: hypothetical protein QOI47_126 [Actinomycetota bacterium]|nr:hypothetical protein [Actinomycetota bacterium]